jgi:hypothetical protein
LEVICTCVPYLYLHPGWGCPIVEINGFGFEINTKGGDKVVRKRFVSEPQQETGFSNSSVSNEQQLDEVIT